MRGARIIADPRKDDRTWARRANPWAGWARLAIKPLAALAFWSPLWLGPWGLLAIGGAFAWALFNLRLFSPPNRWDAWMTRGVLGERLWRERASMPVPAHHRRMPVVVDGIDVVATLILVWGITRASASITLAGLAISTIARLWFIDRMVWLHQDMSQERE